MSYIFAYNKNLSTQLHLMHIGLFWCMHAENSQANMMCSRIRSSFLLERQLKFTRTKLTPTEHHGQF